MIKTFTVESSDTGTTPIIFRETATSNAEVVAQRKYCGIRASYATFIGKMSRIKCRANIFHEKFKFHFVKLA